MVITGKFVFINYPKTGSNFVREVLRKVYRNRQQTLGLYGKLNAKWNSRDDNFLRELELPNIYVKHGIKKSPHGAYSQIPARYRDRRLVSVVRNPYDRLLSIYDFRHWVRYPSVPRKVRELEFPSFPDLSFEMFQKYLDTELRLSWLPEIEMRTEIGIQTVQFIKMFFKAPGKILSSMDEKYIQSDKFLQDMPRITFLSTENLNSELYGFLLSQGFPSEEVDFIVDHERVNVTENSTLKRNNLWTINMLQDFEYKERFLLKILKHYGFDYGKPLLKQ
jgi:hypothetical protein